MSATHKAVVHLPNTGNEIEVEIDYNYYEEGDGFKDPHITESEINSIYCMWERTGREVKQKRLVEVIEEVVNNTITLPRPEMEF